VRAALHAAIGAAIESLVDGRPRECTIAYSSGIDSRVIAYEFAESFPQLKKVDLVSVACLEAAESSVGYAGCGTPPYAPDPGPL